MYKYPEGGAGRAEDSRKRQRKITQVLTNCQDRVSKERKTRIFIILGEYKRTHTNVQLKENTSNEKVNDIN